MTDPDQSGTSADEAGSKQESPAQDQTSSTGKGPAETGSTETTAAGEATEADAAETGSDTASTGTDSGEKSSDGSGSESTEKLSTAQTKSAKKSGATKVGSAEDESEASQSTADADAQETEDQAKPKKSKAGLLLGLVSGALALLIVLVLVAFFIWPGYAGPGSPDSKADEAATALSSKDAGQLDQVSCHSEDGKATAQIPPQALQLIQSAKPSGGTQKILDTEAHAPLDLTLSAQGQTQTLPSIAVLGVSHHQWCLKGLAQRQ